MAILLEEFDTNQNAIIEPEMVAPPLQGFPEIAVTCFSNHLLQTALEKVEKEHICTLDTEEGGTPVYRVCYKGTNMAVYMSRVGAPACAVQMEEMIARGAKSFVVFGSCGVLDRNLGKWHIILPTSAMRDEGVSYHYLPPSDEIRVETDSLELLKSVFEEYNEPYVCGKVWTTDAIYRETVEKTARRKQQGCIAVDMECASLLAVSRFRGISLAQFFYAEDNLDMEVWDNRGLSKGVHTRAERLFEMAQACAKKQKELIEKKKAL
ncbi:nucleoside phosphorylase [Anaerovorax sp. IOR16]|uniref:nucleoside phosphorylase n=1 Tax=Anaerovorax sp. IOR16 TaxID=2773458 RepID=UPI0019D15806|nr:nucleoside phosphorylase [Anaerovorax sp. IOR16]